MNRFWKTCFERMFRFILVCLCVAYGTSTLAKPAPTIPEPLEPWKAWVLHDVKDLECPFFHNSNNKACTWVSETRIDVKAQGATFTVNVDSYSETDLIIPGAREYWPTNVNVRLNQGAAKILPVRDMNGRPQVKLGKGQYQISGTLKWERLPNKIQLSEDQGIVRLRYLGEEKDAIDIDRSHQLWLNRKTQAQENQERDALNVEVYRLLIDENPSKVITRISLNVSGQAREVQVAPVLLDGFIPLQMSSPLPARIDNNRLLRVQVQPGRWNIDVTGRKASAFDVLKFQQPSENWPKEELWAFQADRSLRSVQVSGAVAIDPNQTNLPNEWRQYPAYQVTENQALSFEELHRGDPNPEADTLTLNRAMYLDFSGKGMTIVDNLTGSLQRSWRLDTQPEFHLGNASQFNQALLITTSPDGESEGVELRQKELQLNAVGRVENYRSMPVSGWNADIDSLSATLRLPPGWALVAAKGVDRANYSWISRWSLWHIFLLLITCVAFYRLYGPKLAALSFVTLVLIFHRPGAPLFIWLFIAFGFALIQVTENKLKKFFVGATAALFVLLAIQILPYSVKQIREMIYPQLKHESIQVSYSDDSEGYETPAVANMELARPQAPMEMRQEKAMEVDASAPSRILGDSAPVASLQRAKKKFSYSSDVAQTKIDPNAIVQTGPGVPAWNWDSVRLTWSGPVAKTERMQLYLAPPWLTRIGNGLSVILCILFAAMLFHCGRVLPLAKECFPGLSLLPSTHSVTATMLLFCTALSFVPQSSHADVLIDQKLLDELKTRLTAPAECLPQCAAISSAFISIDNEVLNISMVVDSQANIAMPLPASHASWVPQSVSVNGQEGVVRFSSSGQLLVKLDSGRHTIVLRGKTYAKQFDLAFGLVVHNFSYSTPGWDLSGERKGVVNTGTVQLQQQAQKQAKQDTLVPDPIPSFVEVTRTLMFDLEWTVHTQVRRIAPEQGAITVRVPLLKNEAPTTNINREGDDAVLVFSASQRVHSWQSVLKKAPSIELLAKNTNDYSETWVVRVSPIWNLQYDGIPPIKLSHAPHQPSWKPWAGEKVTLTIARPDAAPGESLTIDNYVMSHTVGQRINESSVRMQVRTSHGQSLNFTLPEGAELDGITIGGVSQALAEKEGEISLPLRPGEQSIELSWHEDSGVAWVSRVPSPKIEPSISNAHLRMKMPRDRWILAVGGPSMGPAVLIWGVLIVVVLLAYALSRIPFMPIKFYQWLLLGLGIASTNLFTPLIVALWLLTLGVRGWMPPPKRVDQLRIIQVFTLIFTVIGLGALVLTIPMGLLSSPDMHIAGNGSGSFMMRWYQDVVTGELPNAWVFSVPMIVYRIAMLLWSLWLAVTLLQWLKWGWLQLNHHGFWHLPGNKTDGSLEDKKEDA